VDKCSGTTPHDRSSATNFPPPAKSARSQAVPNQKPSSKPTGPNNLI
jgi:hypothetical protein